MTPAVRAIALAVAAAIVFGSGIWLTRAGRPYSIGPLTVHKLVDLAAVVVIGMAVYQAHRASPLSALEWAVAGAAAVLTVAVFATGGVLSATENAPAWTLWLHRVGSWIAGVLALSSVYIVSGA
ncbi:MAG: hypothetical protein ACYC77_09140 [Coriobacteriia bacterium]